MNIYKILSLFLYFVVCLGTYYKGIINAENAAIGPIQCYKESGFTWEWLPLTDGSGNMYPTALQIIANANANKFSIDLLVRPNINEDINT